MSFGGGCNLPEVRYLGHSLGTSSDVATAPCDSSGQTATIHDLIATRNDVAAMSSRVVAMSLRFARTSRRHLRFAATSLRFARTSRRRLRFARTSRRHLRFAATSPRQTRYGAVSRDIVVKYCDLVRHSATFFPFCPCSSYSLSHT